MTRRAQLIFVLFFLFVISVPPLVQAGLEVADGGHPQFFDLFVTRPVSTNLRRWEHELEQNSRLAQSVRPWVQFVWFRLLRYAGEKVLVGRRGWLFYHPDQRYLVEPAHFDQSHEDPLPAIVDLRDQLARQHVALLVVPMPGKPSVYPSRLTARAPDHGVRSPTLRFIERLRSAGIDTIDLFSAFQAARKNENIQSLYLRCDTHWSPRAIQIAAEVVARRARELGVRQGDVKFDLRPVSVQRTGDIVRMVQAPGMQSACPAENVNLLQVPGYQDDPASQVLVLGDSFLRMYQTDEPRRAGFIAHLAKELAMPLASIVNDGGASTLVRQELARRPQLLQGKRLVIWEFVERDIRYGTEGWKLIPLPLLQAAREPDPERRDARGLQ